MAKDPTSNTVLEYATYVHIHVYLNSRKTVKNATRNVSTHALLNLVANYGVPMFLSSL